ncbi:hypothetical protein HYU06_04275 [Candidatus Woesearchaeota archaeon]|nr:hypothetical protein [Candidatus Woesearchaeota archaeon]
MPKQITLDEAYEQCNSSGYLKDQDEIDIAKIKTMIELVDATLETADSVKKGLDQKSNKWSIVYSLYYDALHKLIEALILFDNKKTSNHWCLFAYLCKKYAKLELDWDFFEKVRTKRNGIQYYGSPATYSDFKEVELQIKLYFKSIKDTILDKLKNI